MYWICHDESFARKSSLCLLIIALFTDSNIKIDVLYGGRVRVVFSITNEDFLQNLSNINIVHGTNIAI